MWKKRAVEIEHPDRALPALRGDAHKVELLCLPEQNELSNQSLRRNKQTDGLCDISPWHVDGML